MRKNFGVKPYLYPMPVLIIGSYDETGKANAMNAAWGGLSEVNQISICVDDAHKTAENLQKRKAFTVSIADVKNLTACDYVGITSGNKVPDKFKKAGFSAVKSEFVDAPVIQELPMALECEMVSYDVPTCRLVGKIVNVSIDDSVLDENGKVDVAKLAPITFDPIGHGYYVLGERVGDAFKDGIALK